MTKSAHSFVLASALGLISSAGIFSCNKTATPDSAARPSSAAAPLRFGVAPAVCDERTQKEYDVLVQQMGRVLGKPVQLFVAKDYDELGQQILHGGLALAQVSNYLYISTLATAMRKDVAVRVISQERRTSNKQYVGVFVVKANSKVKALSELRGKKMAYVDKNSAAGYYHPRLRLRAAGYDPDTFFSATSFAGSHEAVAAQVKSGEADVGALSEESAHDAGLKIVDKTAPIPEDAIISGGGLSDEDVIKLQAFFADAHHMPELSGFFAARGIARYSQPDVDAYILKK